MIHLHNRTINPQTVEHIFWSTYNGKLIGCHIYFISGGCLDLNQIEANMVHNYYSSAQPNTDRHPVIIGQIKERNSGS